MFDVRTIENMQLDIDELTDKMDAMEAQQLDLARRFAEAFAGGDHIGHCRYHMLMIEEIENKKRMTQAIKEKTISGLIWGALVFVGLAILAYFQKLFSGKL